MDPTVTAGSDITLRCVLNTSATAQTAKDIVWYFKSYRYALQILQECDQTMTLTSSTGDEWIL